MGKPDVRAIRAAVPLSASVSRRQFVCICGRSSDRLALWREHDERDMPIPGNQALVFIAADHADCNKTMRKHPRLYAEQRGDPGSFPTLCGPCTYRQGLGCTHPDLKQNGGQGLLVNLRPTVPHNAIVCPPPSLRARACECAGRTLQDKPTNQETSDGSKEG